MGCAGEKDQWISIVSIMFILMFVLFFSIPDLFYLAFGILISVIKCIPCHLGDSLLV